MSNMKKKVVVYAWKKCIFCISVKRLPRYFVVCWITSTRQIVDYGLICANIDLKSL